MSKQHMHLIMALSLCFSAGVAKAEELRLKASEIFERVQTANFKLSHDGKSLNLIEGTLIENDGAAAGYSYRPNEEVLKDGVVAHKLFDLKHISNRYTSPPPSMQLLVGFSGKTLKARLGGKELELGEPLKAGNYWRAYRIDPKLYESQMWIQLSGEGKLWIARDDERPASLLPRSDTILSARGDGPDFPETQKLGPNKDIEGEYYVRLYLGGFHKDGTLFTGIFDAANLNRSKIPPANVRIKKLEVLTEGFWQGKRPWAGIYFASGKKSDPFLTELSDAGEFHLQTSELRPLPRFFGVHVELPAADFDFSPRFTSLVIKAEIDAPNGWNSRVIKIGENNPEICSYLPWFQHESIDHPRLTKLREQYKLDDVVKGCTTDFERMQKLAVWSSQQWTKGHLKDIYPKWDALEILKLHEDGTPVGGFCQQYNLVFLQACQSFGMVGRCVSIGAGDHGVNIRSGHEVVEIWSNELNKWVYVDGQAAWYFVDKESRTPLNLLELRERQIAALRDKPHREVEVVVLAKSPYEWQGLTQWPAFCELRMIPHTRFLDGKLPIPLNQGMRGWFWTGHRVWTDDLMPASILYDKRITNPRDWNFTVNQTQFWLTQREKEGELDVKLVHNMPSFSHFVVKIGEGEEQTIKEDNVVWPLAKGENRLQVHAVNIRGLRGPMSWARVKYE